MFQEDHGAWSRLNTERIRSPVSAEGVAQVVDSLFSKFKPQYYEIKRKEREKKENQFSC
jgi:hypothetical protein